MATSTYSSLDRLRRLFEVTAGTLRAAQDSCGSVAGCLFGNLALELSNSRSVAIRGRLREIFESQAAMIEEVVGGAKARGDIRAGDPAEAARSIVAQLEGHVMFAKLHNDVTRLDPMWTNSLALLKAQ